MSWQRKAIGENPDFSQNAALQHFIGKTVFFIIYIAYSAIE